MTYIVAVSGGVDSVVLLDMVVGAGSGKRGEGKSYVVAHVDHGIRDDSHEDEQFVRALAVGHGLAYESTRLELGKDASENEARQKRYDWLETIRQKHHAEAIITAHHQDDVIETMMINLVRGTGWRGLCSLRETALRRRPLLGYSRAEIIAYAINHDLSWREDSTNDDVRYLRNYIRYRWVQRLHVNERQRWSALYTSQCRLAELIDKQVAEIAALVGTPALWSRYGLIMCDEAISFEVMTYLLGMRLPRQSLGRLRHFICTGRPGKQFIIGNLSFRLDTSQVFVSHSDIC